MLKDVGCAGLRWRGGRSKRASRAMAHIASERHFETLMLAIFKVVRCDDVSIRGRGERQRVSPLLARVPSIIEFTFYFDIEEFEQVERLDTKNGGKSTSTRNDI